jgi:hypothetical protein
MGKDLRTTPVPLKLHKYKNLDGSAWGLKKPQPFFPPLEKLFKTENLSGVHEYGVRLSDQIDSVIDSDTIRTMRGKSVKVHRKTTSILNPFRWMRGDYGGIGLPKPSEVDAEIQEATQSPHTAGYVGAMTSIVLSESGCIHFPKVYGVFVGLADSHTIDISDDYDDLSEKPWFSENIGKTFELKVKTPLDSEDGGFKHTRGNRVHVAVGDDTNLDIGIQDIEAEHIENPSRLDSISGDFENINGDVSDGTLDEESPNDVFDIESCNCEDEEDDDADEEECDEPFAWATFSNIPVITTIMEKCDMTIYDLMKNHPEPSKHVAWVSQVVFALAFAQRNYGLTHNDLHGNNVMCVPTTQEFLYYKVEGVSYRIPTYGYIIKIIDFDRSILYVRLQGMKDSKLFMSNQFKPEEEAGGQYNIEPFFTQGTSYIPPCPSFDLARFATSMFWDMFPEGPEYNYEHPLFSVFKEWMQQSDKTSVMFRKKMDNHDRYHGFDLYKAIARFCKDAVPKKEISRLSFYHISSVPIGESFLSIDP